MFLGLVVILNKSFAITVEMNHDLVPELHSFNDKAPVMPNKKGEYPIPIPGITNYR